MIMASASVSSAQFMSSVGRMPEGRLSAVSFVALHAAAPSQVSRQYETISNFISHLHYALLCASLLLPQQASKRPYYYREAASKRHSQATPKGGRAVLSLSLGSKTEEKERRIMQACKRIWHE